MNRQQKYPDTSTFHYYNANPHGRITTDCVTRAIATATEIPYNDIVIEMAKIKIETGYDGEDTKGVDIFLKRHGWIKIKQPRKDDNTKYTGKEFCREYNGTYIAKIGCHHIVCIKENKVWDIWDSTDGAVGSFWIKM